MASENAAIAAAKEQAETGGAARCCCIGMIGNTMYKCLGRALDLGHCRGDCPCYPECVEHNDAVLGGVS